MAKRRKKVLLELPMPFEVPITLADKLIACVPNTWLDPLLTGPTAVVRSKGDFTCPDIEALCKAIRARMREVSEGVAGGHMERAPLEPENERLRHLLKRSRIHMESAARKAGKAGDVLRSRELVALAEEIRAAIGETPSQITEEK